LRLGELLVLRDLLSVEDLTVCLERQRRLGGRLDDLLLASGLITQETLDALSQTAPLMPRSVADTGVSRNNLLALVLKFLRFEGCELISELSARIKLQRSVVQELVDIGVAQELIFALGSVTVGAIQYTRYGLSDKGKVAALDAIEQCQYLGPAPISLASYRVQVQRQAIAGETIDFSSVGHFFSHLMLNEHHLRKLLPAASSGQTLLLYGPPGNGKTSIGRLMASLFAQPVFVPYALEIDGQLIKIFDERLHKPFSEKATASIVELETLTTSGGLQPEYFDSRWVICKRPIAMAGGELTLDMLELSFDAESRIYDAPLHMKAVNGVFLIDDFGRQRVAPTDLLNRWIVPLENRIDFLKLKTGKSFSIPFDELVIFSTNLSPADLMDPAFLRRIRYKVHMTGPKPEEYRVIFMQEAEKHGLVLSQEVYQFILDRVIASSKQGLAFFQPRFVCEQVLEICQCFELPKVITKGLASEALTNLYVEE